MKNEAYMQHFHNRIFLSSSSAQIREGGFSFPKRSSSSLLLLNSKSNRAVKKLQPATVIVTVLKYLSDRIKEIKPWPPCTVCVCVCFEVERMSGWTLSERPVSHVCTYGIHFSSSGSMYTIPQRLTVAGEATAKS